MKWQAAPVIGGAYSDNARPWSHQDTVNWLPVRAERPNGRSDWKLTPAPGLKAFSTLTNDSTGAADRIRGVRNVEGRLYVVCGQSLFRINGNGTATTIQENAIPGTQRVTMTHNQETGGNTLVMTNGYGGWTYNTGTATFAEITDEGFPGFKVCDFLDQYIVGIDPTGRFAFHSELANAGSYSTLDRYEAEAAPDRLVGQVVDHGQWWLMGERTIEVYTNTGSATGTFQRIPGSTIERGLAGTHAVAKLDNSVFWLGDDGVVYRANGYTPVRISTHPIEQELSQCDLSLAFCMVYEDRGHKILYLTCPDGKTWGYDVATQEWHRRQSYGRSNWRMESLVRWSGGWYGGDKLTNKLQRVDWGYQDEDGQPLIAERITGILHGNQNRVQVHGIELVLDTGRVPGPVRPPAEIVYPVEIYNPLETAYLNVAVSHTYLARYGVEPYTFSLDAGTLPTGLSLASSGALTGTPSALGSFAWRVKVTDAIGQTDTLDQGVDLVAGINGDPFEVTYKPPMLVTDSNSYAGDPDALDLGAATGFPSVTDLVRVSPNGLYAVGCDMDGTTSERFKIIKYDVDTDTWSTLSDPATLPARGPNAVIWTADSSKLICATPTGANGTVLTVYHRSGDTFTLASTAADPNPNSPVIFSIALSPDESRLAVGNANTGNTFCVFDFDGTTISGRRNENNVGNATGNNRIAFHPDPAKNYIAVGSSAGTGRVEVYTDNGTAISYVTGVAAYGSRGLFWEGDYLIAIGFDGANLIGSVISFNEGTSTLTVESSGVISAASIADTNITYDGRYIVLANTSPVIYEVTQTTPPTLVLADTAPASASAAVTASWANV